MRLPSVATILPGIISILFHGANAEPSSGGGSALYPPGLLPLINQANALLSAGQFNDAAKAFSDAIGEYIPFNNH